MHSIQHDVGHLADPSRLKINEMLDASTEDRQTPLPHLTVPVDATQHRRAKNETANCGTSQPDHSNLFEGPSAATPPRCSLRTQLSVQMNSAVSACPPAKLLSGNPE